MHLKWMKNFSFLNIWSWNGHLNLSQPFFFTEKLSLNRLKTFNSDKVNALKIEDKKKKKKKLMKISIKDEWILKKIFSPSFPSLWIYKKVKVKLWNIQFTWKVSSWIQVSTFNPIRVKVMYRKIREIRLTKNIFIFFFNLSFVLIMIIIFSLLELFFSRLPSSSSSSSVFLVCWFRFSKDNIQPFQHNVRFSKKRFSWIYFQKLQVKLCTRQTNKRKKRKQNL